jgi:hypothetical protein
MSMSPMHDLMASHALRVAKSIIDENRVSTGQLETMKQRRQDSKLSLRGGLKVVTSGQGLRRRVTR